MLNIVECISLSFVEQSCSFLHHMYSLKCSLKWLFTVWNYFSGCRDISITKCWRTFCTYLIRDIYLKHTSTISIEHLDKITKQIQLEHFHHDKQCYSIQSFINDQNWNRSTFILTILNSILFILKIDIRTTKIIFYSKRIFL